jgi:hypothetical protein
MKKIGSSGDPKHAHFLSKPYACSSTRSDFTLLPYKNTTFCSNSTAYIVWHFTKSYEYQFKNRKDQATLKRLFMVRQLSIDADRLKKNADGKD